MLSRSSTVVASAALILGAAMPAQAQQSRSVNVDLSNQRADIAKRINVDESKIPVNVQLPISTAARVCGVDANVLALQDKGSAPSCQVRNKSQALNEEVQRQLVAQK
jgi:hypothetical protein